MIAPDRERPTVPEVLTATPFQRDRHRDLLERSLGSMFDDIVDLDGADPMPRLRTEFRPADPNSVRFRHGAQSRKLDDAGRIRLRWDDGTSISELLGWTSGLLDAVTSDGWLVLSQRADQARKRVTRSSSCASVTGAETASERISLRPAHLDRLGVAKGAHVLVAPIPGAGVLVITDPCRIAAQANDQIRDLLRPERNPDE